MKLPKDDNQKLDLYREVTRQCLASRSRRIEQYSQNRRWYLYGSNDGIAADNKIFSHLDQVRSFLYASDSTRFSVRLSSLALGQDYKRAHAFGRRVNEEWKLSNADNIMQVAVLWALVYASTFVKVLRKKGGGLEPYVVDPGTFGVYEENVPMLDRQEAFVHVTYVTESALLRALALHPRRAEIMKSVAATNQTTTTQDNVGPMVRDILITSQAMGGVGMANITGITPTPMNSASDEIIPEYAPQVEVPLIEYTELWVWNDAEDDYQVVSMAGSDDDKRSIVYDRQNVYLPRRRGVEAEQPFVQICPNPMYDYFWGAAEVDKLAPLQAKRNHRHEQIDILLDKQANPPGAWAGGGLAEEKYAAFNIPGAQIAVDEQNLAYKTYIPTMPPDLYQSIAQNDKAFDDMSGLPNVTQGKGESGVRSAGHAGKLLTVGSSRAKARANIVEDSLEKAATLYGKCLYVDDPNELTDEDGNEFIIAQMSPHFIVEVDSHSNSPVFQENNRELAATYLKAGLITPQRFLEMTSPPMLDELLREYNEKIVPARAKAAAEKNAAIAKGEAAKNGGKPALTSAGG